MKKLIYVVTILIILVSCNDKKKDEKKIENQIEIEKIEKSAQKIDSISVKIEKSAEDLEKLLENL